MCFILEEESAIFTGDNVLGHGTTAMEDLSTFQASLQRMADQSCRLGFPAHGVAIEDPSAKLTGELGSKLRRERQVLQALGEIAARGTKSATLYELVSEIYGSSVDEKTRTLALQPFIEEVLKKLAADGKVAFEDRGGKKKWFVAAAARRAVQRAKTVNTVVEVQESIAT